MGIVIDQEYELVDMHVDRCPLKEHPQNPNKGDTEVIDESITMNGWYGAITAQRSTGYILAGNHSFRTARHKGAKQIPVIWRDVDDETALRILLADNETAKRSAYDEQKLEAVLASLDTLEGTGFDRVSRQEQLDSDADGSKPRIPGESNGDGGGVKVPDDKVDEQWAVIIICASEKQQEETYRWFKQEWPDREIRLTAT